MKLHEVFDNDNKVIKGPWDNKPINQSSAFSNATIDLTGPIDANKIKSVPLSQMFGDDEYSKITNAGFEFSEKPSYMSDISKTISVYYLDKIQRIIQRPLHEYSMDQFLSAKSTGFRFGPKYEYMPQSNATFSELKYDERTFILRDDMSGDRYLVNRTGANSYIRMWMKIVDSLKENKEQSTVSSYKVLGTRKLDTGRTIGKYQILNTKEFVYISTNPPEPVSDEYDEKKMIIEIHVLMNNKIIGQLNVKFNKKNNIGVLENINMKSKSNSKEITSIITNHVKNVLHISLTSSDLVSSNTNGFFESTKLRETPIGSIDLKGEWDKPNHIGFGKIDQKLLQNPSHHQRIRKAFNNTPYMIDLIFFPHSSFEIKGDDDDHNYSVDSFARGDYDGSAAGIYSKLEILDEVIVGKPGVITLVLASNLSPKENKIPMTPWIIAHKIGHAIQDEVGRYDDTLLSDLIFQLEMIIEKIRIEFYSYTFKSAKNLSNSFEIPAELIAQYLIQGKVTLIDLKEDTNEYHQRQMRIYEENINTCIKSMLDEIVGKVLLEY